MEYLLFQGYYFQTKKMLKVAILDDYQNIAKDFIDLKKLSSKYEFRYLMSHLKMKMMQLNN